MGAPPPFGSVLTVQSSRPGGEVSGHGEPLQPAWARPGCPPRGRRAGRQHVPASEQAATAARNIGRAVMAPTRWGRVKHLITLLRR